MCNNIEERTESSVIWEETWIDISISTKRQASLSGLSAGLKKTTGKGKRLIIPHIGSKDGFLEGKRLIFLTK